MDNKSVDDSVADRASLELAGPALVRRRLLLKGLTKGGAVAAACVPIKTLAQSSTLVTNQNTLCTQSGQSSNVTSRVMTKVTCEGYSPSHYVKSGPLPNDWPTGFNANSMMFRDLFPSSGDNTKVLGCLAQSVSSANAYWIAAYFNATKYPGKFPYTASEVVQQYVAGATTNVSFYQTYLSSKP
jgi:hypothetical protein